MPAEQSGSSAALPVDLHKAELFAGIEEIHPKRFVCGRPHDSWLRLLWLASKEARSQLLTPVKR